MSAIFVTIPTAWDWKCPMLRAIFENQFRVSQYKLRFLREGIKHGPPGCGVMPYGSWNSYIPSAHAWIALPKEMRRAALDKWAISKLVVDTGTIYLVYNAARERYHDVYVHLDKDDQIERCTVKYAIVGANFIDRGPT